MKKRNSSVYLISLGADYVVFLIMIVVFNLHLVGIGRLDSLIFIPGAAAAGELWRFLTHPFAHVSWYHLSLDASAFFMLYSQLFGTRLKRVTHVGLCGVFSLGAAWIWSPDIAVLGLCGLSGIAHGLMAVVSLEMIQSGREKTLGMICLIAVSLKSIFEIISGGVMFSFVHAGLCGTPMVACHMGGVLGGLVSYGVNVYKKQVGGT